MMTSLRHKLWLGFGGLVIILVAVGVFGAALLRYSSTFLQQSFHDNYRSALYCDAMRESLDQLDLRAQQMIWGAGGNSAIDPLACEQRFTDNLSAQNNNITVGGEGELTQQLQQLWGKFLGIYPALDTAPADQRVSFYRQQLLPVEQDMRNVAQQITAKNMNYMAMQDGEVQGRITEVRNLLLILVIGGAALSAIVVWAGGAAVLHSLATLTRSARQIEAGDLDLSLAVRSRDELGMLAQAFNSMAARLKEFRRLDHDRLERTQQTTQLAIDSLPDAVFVVGPLGVIEISNRSAEALFGIAPGMTVEQLGQKLKWLGPLYDRVKEGRVSEEPPGYRSAVQLFENGHERFLLPRAVPMLGPDSTPIGVAVFLVDVTRLRSADEAKSGLVSTVSHELRTPLTSIRMALGMLRSAKFGELSATQLKLVGAAHEDAERLYRIIENLMSIARIESGRAQFQFQDMRAGQIVQQAVDPLRAGFAEKNIALESTVADGLPLVQADAAVISSALMNLLSNALKFTPSGGRVTVRAAGQEGGVAFTVTDTGPGIPGEFANRVFDKFFRVPRKEGPTGAGLGLAIAKEVVEAHGGTIRLVSTSPAGSTFQFFLPCRPQSLTFDGSAATASTTKSGFVPAG